MSISPRKSFSQGQAFRQPDFLGACREFLLVKKGDILNSSKRNFDPSLNT